MMNTDGPVFKNYGIAVGCIVLKELLDLFKSLSVEELKSLVV
jgi:hypothetical protein